MQLTPHAERNHHRVMKWWRRQSNTIVPKPDPSETFIYGQYTIYSTFGEVYNCNDLVLFNIDSVLC